MEKNMVSTTAKQAQEVLASLAGDQADELRAQINESLQRARESLKASSEQAKVRGQEAVASAEDYVQAKPWQAIGIAAGAGFLIGLLATRH
jgi:ElaB/YqjD/DUF883 family membrane-anchored ribosome-binding protein